MSKHDLKGIDLSKVGNNKNVNYTFKDYMEDMGLTKTGADERFSWSRDFFK